jgi:membrane fusion protein, multidrug efflux system
MNPVDPKSSATAAGAAPKAAPPVRLMRILFITTVIILIGLAIGFVPRWFAHRRLAQETKALAVTWVAVVSPTPGKSELGVPLPAEVQAYVEAPIYARASGYLKRWLVDIGATVTNGQLLAEIDTPELDQQLAQAKAEVAQNQAALDLAKITAARWTDLLKTASVSAQETAEKLSDLDLKKANLDAALANLHRLEELKTFASVTAPFDGTITARQTDVGQLITAGSGRELFRLAQVNPLRIYVRVPQTMSQAVAPGQTAELILDQFPGRKIAAKVVRTAGAIEPGSRTLLTELAADNSRGEILAGSYAQVRFNESAAASTLTLPANALLFRSTGMCVGVVGADGKVEMRNVKLGRDYGQTVEILEGVSASDRVIMNPPDLLANGQMVRVAEPVKSVAEK